jgi:transcriptional regulator of acetoin/glycerol metabolism
LARLDGYRVQLPPLRHRREDLGLILSLLLRRLAGARAGAIKISTTVGRWLLTHDWPHNVRQLEQYLGSVLALGGDEISTLFSAEQPPATSELPLRPAPALSDSEQVQRGRLMDLLMLHRGNISAVARDLGKERIQIRRWIKRFGLDAETMRKH